MQINVIGASSRSSAYFGRGSGSIWLDNVQCGGGEKRLLDCTANSLGSHDCSHYEDAGIVCTTSKFYKSCALISTRECHNDSFLSISM